MLRITFQNGDIVYWEEEKEFDEYRYDGTLFIVIKGKQWVGLYNIDCISSVVYSEDGLFEGK